jgi:glycosyltransferase involved in cell wall biosynthesis
VAKAQRILADSESTRRDLIELLDVPPERVTVLYPGVEGRFRPVRDPEELGRVRDRYQLPERFVLGLSTLQPRKNFAGLVEGFRRLVGTRSDLPETAKLQLVIGGAKGWMYDDAFVAVAEAGLEHRVHFAGFVDDADLPALYSLAVAFAFPTWYEGFGLPALEAMACGTPVVAADNSSLPEVVGEAGLLADAADPDALARALARLLTEEGLRERLTVAGPVRAAEFRWETAARQLFDIYQDFA